LGQFFERGVDVPVGGAAEIDADEDGALEGRMGGMVLAASTLGTPVALTWNSSLRRYVERLAPPDEVQSSQSEMTEPS
jgi:hypothetical protein